MSEPTVQQKFEADYRQRNHYNEGSNETFFRIRLKKRADRYVNVDVQNQFEGFKVGYATGSADMRERAAEKADLWAKSKSCTAHDNDPCCHVRTGTGIAAAIRSLPGSPSEATKEEK